MGPSSAVPVRQNLNRQINAPAIRAAAARVHSRGFHSE